MNHTIQIKQKLQQLKLSGFAQSLEQQLMQPTTYEGLSFSERLSLLLDAEITQRADRRQRTLTRQAHFKLQANLQEIDYDNSRQLDRSMVASLAQGDWINRKQNLLITGACGSGKTYLAYALGHSACQKHQSVKYFRISRLFLALMQAKADGTYRKLLTQLSKVQLLILDDWGLEALSDANRHDLMEIMDDRHEATSTIIISQLPTDQWYSMIGDNTLADAILDRLMHNAHRINLKGESMRKKRANLTQSEHLVVK
jgi:DNA replication protein DnaC